MAAPPQLSRPARWYIAAVILGGLAILPIGWAFHPLAIRTLPELIYLAVGVQIAALMPIEWPKGAQTVVDPLLLAAGLAAPGFGVAGVAWVGYFDARRGTADVVRILYNKASLALAHGTISIVIASLPSDLFWSLPARTLLYSFAYVAVNYLLTARVLAFVHGVSVWHVLNENVRISTIGSTLTLTFAGGILYLLLLQPVGFLLAPGLFGFLIAVRGNVADAQRQAEAREQTLQLAAQALDARDPYTESHSARVGMLAGQLGELMQLSGRECEHLKTAGILHDIGKIGIRDNILNKSDALTAEEWEAMKRHPDIGADMIIRHSALASLAPAVRHHHERWDGSGYPSGLSGKEIPLGARIISVADSFDTITTPRLYRPTAMSSHEAVEHISDRAGIWYDVKVVDALRGLHSLPSLEPAEAALVLPTRPSGLLQLLLAYPKFRIFLAGSAISALGDPLTTVATLVSVYAVTHDSRLVAATYVIQAAATILMTGVIGGLADRLKRRSQIAMAEFGRAIVLVLTPFLIAMSLYWILPVLFLLAALNAVSQPSRQAAVADLVAPGDVGRATAALVGSGMTAAAVGFPVAGLVLLIFHSISSLFIIDAITFGLAGFLILDVGQLGGGIERVGLTSAVRRTWSVRPARPHLLLMAFAVFCLSMSYPALIALAYSLASSNGAQAYTFLETTVAVGIVVGSLLVGSLKAIGTMRTASVGLIITGVMSLGVALSPNLWIAALVLLIASVANPIFAVGNQTALLQLTQPSNRGAIMTSRFGLGQTALIVGAAVGGFLTTYFKAQGTYAFLAIGLLLLGTIAFMRDRRSTLSSAHVSVDGVADVVADPLHVATKSATS